MFRMLERVGGRQVATQAVADKHHLVDAHGLPPGRQRRREEPLRFLLCPRREPRPPCMRAQVDSMSAFQTVLTRMQTARASDLTYLTIKQLKHAQVAGLCLTMWVSAQRSRCSWLNDQGLMDMCSVHGSMAILQHTFGCFGGHKGEAG